MTREVLGRGIEALIPVREEGRIHQINVSEIVPSDFQARKKFGGESLAALALSIKENGIIQPIVVAPSGKGWKLIAGERRLRASKMAGLKKIPAIIKESDGEEIAVTSLVENIQRENLNPLEEARGIAVLMKNFSLTQEEVSRRIGCSRSKVANTLRLLKFPQEIVDALDRGQISEGHARALAAIGDRRKREYLIRKISKEHLTVRDIERIAFVKKRRGGRKILPDIAEIAEKIEETLSTKVEVKMKSRNQGYIKIHFFSDKEFERITKRILGK
ncbi:MAG: ParB/RepB/Spo0J family partition protein [Elusimicrobia bacterium]|nr:ParB/RepB/Spo0J family partition protein [Elusimicrobiota bacterium]